MSKKGGFLGGALFGAVIAAGAALLFSPKSGKELREELKGQIDEFKDAEDKKGVALQKKDEALEKAAAKKEELLEKAKAKKDESLEKAQVKRDEFKGKFEAKKEDFQGKISEKTGGKSDEALSKLQEGKEKMMAKLKKQAPTSLEDMDDIELAEDDLLSEEAPLSDEGVEEVLTEEVEKPAEDVEAAVTEVHEESAPVEEGHGEAEQSEEQHNW